MLVYAHKSWPHLAQPQSNIELCACGRRNQHVWLVYEMNLAVNKQTLGSGDQAETVVGWLMQSAKLVRASAPKGVAYKKAKRSQARNTNRSICEHKLVDCLVDVRNLDDIIRREMPLWRNW